MNLPVEFTDNMRKLLGDEYSDFLLSYDKPSYHGLRINRLKITSEDFINLSPFELQNIPYIDNGFIYNDKDNPAKDAYYHAGLYYLQEPSAMLPANRLPICKGDKVLDLCAAPGGKATELAGKLGRSGLLYANDISASRALALLKNLELASADNIYVTAETPENLAKRLPEFFDKILCDVPCSGEGMFRKDSSLIKSWIDKGPQYYQPIQRGIIDSAYEMLAPGGMLMYSTCTFSEAEDEDNILYFLEKHDDMELVDIEWYEGFSHGTKGLDKCVRVFPHKMIGEGHFLALLKKKALNNVDNTEDRPVDNIADRKKISKQSKDKKETIEYLLPAMKDNGYRDGIRYIRTGLMLGDSQSFAMTLNCDSFKNSISFSHDDIRVSKYLKGETIFLEDGEEIEKGLALVLVDGYALGFVKADQSMKLKNLYNKGWRMV